MLKPIEIVFLGEVDYMGEPAEAYREEYENYCRFIIKTENRTIVLMEYPKIN